MVIRKIQIAINQIMGHASTQKNETAHTQIALYIGVYAYICINTYMHMHIHIHIYVHIHIHKHIYIHIITHLHLHIHIRRTGRYKQGCTLGIWRVRV